MILGWIELSLILDCTIRIREVDEYVRSTTATLVYTREKKKFHACFPSSHHTVLKIGF